jgi:hypothetical protein
VARFEGPKPEPLRRVQAFEPPLIPVATVAFLGTPPAQLTVRGGDHPDAAGPHRVTEPLRSRPDAVDRAGKAERIRLAQFRWEQRVRGALVADRA